MGALGKNMRMIARFRKGDSLKHISHLDVQRTLQRALRRAQIPVAYSNGFNPHILLSFATALGTGIISEAEWFDVELREEYSSEAFLERMQKVLPRDLMITDAFPAPDGFGTLSSHTVASAYTVEMKLDQEFSGQELQNSINQLLSKEIFVEKRTKGGIRPVDIRPQVLSASVVRMEGRDAVLAIEGRLQTDGGLRVEHLLDALSCFLGCGYHARIVRTEIFYDGTGNLPQMHEQEVEEV
jgi:radical SAM-linked protein